jgi:hypothetical protein
MAKRVAIAAATASMLFLAAGSPASLMGQDRMQTTTLTDRQQQLRERMDSLRTEYMQLVGKRDSTGALVIPYCHRQFPYNPGNPSMEAGLNGKLPSGFQVATIDNKTQVSAIGFDHYPRPFKWIEGMLKNGEVYEAEQALGIVGNYVAKLKEHINSLENTKK